MILVLAGTLEGRIVADLLQQAGFSVQVSAVTDYGTDLLTRQGIEHISSGPLDETALRQVLKQGITLLVDATHPFASLASQNAMSAAATVGVPYLRLERLTTAIPSHPLVHDAASLQDCIQKALGLGKVLFSTLGSKNLPALLAAARPAGVRVVARVLPVSGVLHACRELGLTPADLVALQGPCSRELNVALYRQYQAQVVLTKNSGPTGGVEEKIAAALQVGIPIVVWQRPRLHYPLVLHQPTEVVQYCLKNLKTG